MAIDYWGIEEALAGLFANLGFKKTFIEAMERDIIFDHCPLINIRMTQADENPSSVPNDYYMYLTFEIDVITFSLRSFKEAVTLRSSLLGAAQDAVQKNSRFHGDVNESRLGPQVKFGALTTEGAGAQFALATFAVTCGIYIGVPA